MGLRRQGRALTSVFEQYLCLQGGWAGMRGILQGHQFDTLRQVAYHRVAHSLIVVGKRVGQIARERYRGSKWQAVLPAHDAFRRPHGVPLFHETRGATNNHPRDVLRLQWMLSLEILDRLDDSLMRDMGRIGF